MMMPTASPPEVPLEESEDFETNQSVLAAYLVYCGHELASSQWENGICTFFFPLTKELSNDFGIFLQSKARVEPVSFNNAFGQVMRVVKDARAREKTRLGLQEDQRLEDADNRRTI